jgi:hydroxymethylbilane synthase
MAHLRIGTRRSPLAVWQAEHVAGLLREKEPLLTVELAAMSTRGDRILDAPLAHVGGKGLFVKEIEEALLRGDVDLAVHSLKDVPAQLPAGLVLHAFPPRADPRDAWVSKTTTSVAELPQRARVGTASLRRQCQILAQRPDVQVVPIRGSVETRLHKLETENLDALVLAAAGLDRLGLGARVARRLQPHEMLPAVGQGILALEIRQDDFETAARVRALDDDITRKAALCERALLQALGGGCQVPIAAHACLLAEGWWLRSLVADPGGAPLIRSEGRAPTHASCDELQALGTRVGQNLLSNGGRQILDALSTLPAPGAA